MEGFSESTMLLALLGGFIGSVLCFIAEKIWVWKHDDKPYKWKCPEKGCSFMVEANQPDFPLRMAETHKHPS